MSAQGQTNTQIAKHVGLSISMVGLWRKRFIDQGLMGLYDQPKPGAPRKIGDDQVAQLIQKTLNKKPKSATHWTCQSIAKETQLSKSTIQRIWRAFNLQPHRQKHFTLSTDPYFVEKVRDIVGLYLNPPDKAMVLCVDEKSQIQALDRTQPVLPMDLGYLEGNIRFSSMDVPAIQKKGTEPLRGSDPARFCAKRTQVGEGEQMISRIDHVAGL